ncbi:hypothetical protein F4808DRAFT_473050 [Astrocystis sublimbata]|nr:hypothetical protein F4808DRAFT_473050 [Astrocystis sublimbata]
MPILATCDQQRPSCINCQNSDRVCTYRSADAPRAAEAPSTSGASSSDHVLPHSIADAARGPSSLAGLSTPASPEPLVNVAHLEILHHFTECSLLFITVEDTESTRQLKQTALSLAFSTSYLMHGILAFSARHLSTQVGPERSRYYLDHSNRLQAWAVANFNPAPRAPDTDTCVALFLFSSLICVQSLAEISELGGEPEPFFIRFGQFFGLQRGVATIMADHWFQLRSSKMRELLEWCEALAKRKGRGRECDALRQLVTQSMDLSPAAKEACHLAIEQLQCGFDEYTLNRPLPAHQICATLAWPLLIPEKMVDLLVLRRPAPMIILAYYGVALDSCRVWMVGETGKRIVDAVKKHMGADWASWLRWPCEAVGLEVP